MVAPGRGVFAINNTPNKAYQIDLLRNVQFETNKANICSLIEKPLSTKPLQTHHFISPINKRYTQHFRDITDPLGLDLNDSWNKALLPHQGRHPFEYHKFVLHNMNEINNIKNLTPELFIKEFNSRVINPVTKNPDMLYKNYWNNLNKNH